MKKCINLLCIALILLLGACSGDDVTPQEVKPQITGFKVIEPVEATGEVNEANKTITVYLPGDIDFTSVKVEIEVPAGATVSPASNSTVNFSEPVEFTVKGKDAAGNEITQTYTATAVKNASVAFVGRAATIAELEDDAEAAANWMKETYGDDFIYLPASAINASSLNGVKVVVYYELSVPSEVINLGPMANSTVSGAIRQFVKDGGQLFLAGDASQYVFNIGRVPASYEFGEKNHGGIEEGKDPNDYWGFSVVPTTTSADRTSHPLFEGLLNEENRVFLNNAPTREVRLVWWNVGPAGGDCCGNLDMVTNFENKLNAVKLGSLRHVTDYFGFAAIEFKRTDRDTHAELVSTVPKDFKGNILVFANSIIGYEWNVNDGSPNDAHENIEKITYNAIEYLRGLYDAE